MRDICQMIDLYWVTYCRNYLFLIETTLFYPLYLFKEPILLILFSLLTDQFTTLIESFLPHFMSIFFTLLSLTLFRFLTMAIHSQSLLKVLPLCH